MDAAFFEAISGFDIDQATVKIGTLEHRNYDITVKIKNGGVLDTTRDTTINGYTLNVNDRESTTRGGRFG